MDSARLAVVGVLVLVLLDGIAAQSDTGATYLRHARARPVFEALGEPVPAVDEWPRWIAAADAATRARVTAGDEISVVNLLLFGTSFTAQPLPLREAERFDLMIATNVFLYYDRLQHGLAMVCPRQGCDRSGTRRRCIPTGTKTVTSLSSIRRASRSRESANRGDRR